jgi:hypothetical protein
MRNLVIAVYFAAIAGGYAAYLRANRAVPDTIALQDAPGAVAYEETDSGSPLDLPHPVAASKRFPPADSLAPRRLAFVPKSDISPMSAAISSDPELAASEPDPLPAARSTRMATPRLASLGRTPASSAFAMAFPADGDLAAALDVTSSTSGAEGLADLTTAPGAPIVGQAGVPADGELAPPQAGKDGQPVPAAQASPSVAHFDAVSGSHALSDAPVQSSSAAPGSSGELPVAGSPMT